MEQTVLEGRISVIAALRARNRAIEAVYIAEDREARDTRDVEAAARSAGVTVQRIARELLENRAGGKTHGGVIAIVGDRRYLDLPDLLPANAVPFIAMLDGVEDPYNFGSSVRSLFAAGAHGLVVRPRNWMSAAGIVARASGGASELIPAAVAESADKAAEFYAESGLLIACASNQRAVSLFSADLTVPLFLLIGGEQRGVTRSFLRNADVRLRIPYGRAGALDLGVAAATAVLAFEVMRQRHVAGYT